jgi:uncharacterized protein YceK
MTIRACRAAALAAALPFAVGCGTVANLAAPGPVGKVPFGGVKRDLERVDQATHGVPEAGSHPAAQAALWRADLPFTAVGDTLTWPYTAAYTFINSPTPVPPILIAPAAYPPSAAEGQPQSLPPAVP